MTSRPMEEQQEDGRKVKRRINIKTSVAKEKRKNDVLEMEEENEKGQNLVRRRITEKTNEAKRRSRCSGKRRFEDFTCVCI